MRTKTHKKSKAKYIVCSLGEIYYEDFSSLEEAKARAITLADECCEDDFVVAKVVGEAIFDPPEEPVNNVRYVSHE